MKLKAKLIASLRIWIVIYPSITLFLAVFGKQLSGIPLYVRTLILTLSLVPWMIFAGLPLLDQIIRTIVPGNGKNSVKE
jgi:antibiotic biosynthesis monooxygenase (ABM) superfamily enzyme